MIFFPALLALSSDKPQATALKNGFTMIELLVVVTIIGILTILATASYNNFNTNQTLTQAVNTIKANMRLVQTRAFEGVKPAGCTNLTGWRVSFEANSYSLVGVCDGSEIEISRETFVLSGAVSYDSGPLDLLFLPLSRGIDITDDVSLTFSLEGKTQMITVSSTGKIQ